MIRGVVTAALAALFVCQGWGSPTALAAPNSTDGPPPVALGSSTRATNVIKYDAGPGVLRVGNVSHAIPGATGWKAEPVIVGGLRAAVVHFQDAKGRAWAAVLGPGKRSKLLWLQRLTPTGDPGERLGHRITVDASGGLIQVGVVHEAARLCGDRTLPMLDAQQLQRQGARLAWQRAPVTATPEATGDTPALVGTRDASAPKPLVSLLTAQGQSSTQGAPERALQSPPFALLDGDRGTGWQAQTSLPGEFVTFRVASGTWAIERIGVVVTSPAAASVSSTSRRAPAAPQTMRLVGEDRQQYRLAFPKHSDMAGGQVVWFALPAPWRGACLTLQLEEAAPPGDAAVGAAELPALALQEVIALSPLDQPGGLDALVASLATDEASVRLLQAAPGDVVERVAAAVSGLSPLGRLRALRVLAVYGKTHAKARAALLAAMGDSEPGVRKEALQALLRSGAPGAAELAAAVAGPGGADIALALARAGRRELATPLLAALARPEGASRKKLRLALSTLVTRSPKTVDDVAAWTATEPALAASAAVALALASADAPEAKPVALALVVAKRGQATEFEDRYRLVEASAALPPEGAVDQWLAQLAGTAPEWMLRSAALRALSARKAESVLAVATQRLTDPVPRVRAAAVRALAKHGDALPALAKHAEHDVWFLVRIAAIEAVADGADARALIRGRVADPSSTVRRAAIARLTSLEDRDSWPAVRARMTAEREFADVIEAGVDFAEHLCVHAALPDLEALVGRGLGPDARETGRGLAVRALGAMAHLGSPRARAMASAFGGADAPRQGLQRAIADAAGRPAGCSNGGVAEPVQAASEP